LVPYIPASWTSLGTQIGGQSFAAAYQRDDGEQLGILVRHPLASAPDNAFIQQALINGIRCASFTTFDFDRRPFWIINELAIV
ncbi:MAG TPA: hypothetical protein VJ723_04740, partial [Candidatus Angelobacter sp.]|nr:hypothetical protein [Candidatus Angelobacter sp.]